MSLSPALGSSSGPPSGAARRPWWTGPGRMFRKLWAIAAATLRSQLESMAPRPGST